MLVSALLKSSDTVRASCNAHSSFCLNNSPPPSVAVLVSSAVLTTAGASGAAAGTGAGAGADTVSGNNCSTNSLLPSRAKEQTTAVKFIVAPVVTFSFKSRVSLEVDPQRLKKSSGVPLFSGAQIADNGGDSLAMAAPNVLTADMLARRMTNPEFTSIAGQAALSRPNTISGFMQSHHSNPSSVPAYLVLGKFQGMTNAEGSSPRTVKSRILPSARLSATHTFAAGAYSASNWRQAPHGMGPPGARATTATATKSLSPPVNALNKATRSA